MDQNQSVFTTSISGLVLIQRPTASDDRGFFREPARIKEIEEATGESFNVRQMNHARSSKNTLRGIHIAPWNKLIYVTAGNIQAVIVDLRQDSQTFGKYESFIIGEDKRSSIFIPKGCGNSYLVLSDQVDYIYLTDQEWAPNLEKGVIWNDPTLNINWNLLEPPILSEKDQQNSSLKELFPTVV